jgi:hypothetical protein
MVLDQRSCADVAIVIAAAPVTANISGTVITGGAVIAIGSVIGVPTIIFVRRPGVQETPCRRVLLGRLVVLLLF